MAFEQTLTTSFKQDILLGVHDLDTDTIKMALFLATADLNATTTVYTTASETSGTGYTAGGKVLTPVAPALDPTNNTAFISFANAVWTPAVFTARGALVYNSTTGAACFVLDFGSDKTASSTFTVTFPAASSTNAIIRIN